eukprot:TRINITY_DN168402_c0_g1_i1.p1 TRINITY_DN168402_c0_g1~~TRINITY_DN168402_c0_g1_i1.p1  ORF type:complete len:111 (+),score=16.13 TRINITY_DN168402_c0_g1_i1:12-344(+)
MRAGLGTSPLDETTATLAACSVHMAVHMAQSAVTAVFPTAQRCLGVCNDVHMAQSWQCFPQHSAVGCGFGRATVSLPVGYLLNYCLLNYCCRFLLFPSLSHCLCVVSSVA